MTYPTTFSLDHFIQDLKERALFLESWVNAGFPRRINLSAIMYPDCLLTALLQVTKTKSEHFLFTENFLLVIKYQKSQASDQFVAVKSCPSYKC